MRARHPSKFAIAVAIAGAVVCIAIPAAGAPLPSGAAHFKSTAVSDIEQVRWRGHRGGGAVIGGIAAGMLLGGIIASSPYYYGGPYYYGAIRPIAMVRRTGKPIASRVIARSIPIAAPI